MTVNEYIQRINERYRGGRSTEHSYRGDLLNLLESLLPDLAITNEPKRIEAGAPDYILTRNGIPAGFIEAKDLGDPDLAGKKKHKEQFDRYKATQDPFIFTDYLDFHLYLQGEFITSIRIADIEDGEIVPRPERFEEFRDLIRDFVTHTGQTIRSAARLSKMMAGKARLLSDVIERALRQDEKTDGVNEAANNSLREQLAAFQNVLIHDIDAEEFADIYAQTIAYGMFAARLHDPTLDTFSRHEAAELIPKTNPFLRKLFQYIAGYDLDDRLVWIVDALADIFRATDVAALLEDFGKATQQNDPIIHFYETFLAEFDPALRKSRGVWYTPEPVVNFIVRAVDDILKDEFDLKDGLADTSKTTVKVKTDVKDGRKSDGYKEEEREVHKVQILDPAAGTGTFLAEVIQQIYQQFEGQQGLWPSYVENHLIPRLNGFELLMASYAMAHLKLDMLLRETGYDREASQRFRVFLTNSLEEHHPDTGTLFANWLSEEANQANRVKRDTPVMVVMGNPPYSVSSSNKGEWIQNLITDYKKDLKEKKLNLDDDYIKFIRYGEHFIEKNGEGVLAYISNNSFLDGITHRKMREHLLSTFDKIYVLNLHGSYMKNETTPDGGKDENVFDIQQGVSITFLIKNSTDKKVGELLYSDIYGRRQHKYKTLIDQRLGEINWEDLKSSKPYNFFVPKNFTAKSTYDSWLSVSDLFKIKNSGIQTDRDSLFIDFNKKNLQERIRKLLTGSFDKKFKKNFRVKDSSSYKITSIIEDENYSDSHITKEQYRPFDYRYIYYDKNVISRPAYKVSKHFVNKTNIGLQICKQQSTYDFQHILISATVVDRNSISMQTKEATYFFPLYLYPEDDGQQSLDGRSERRPNLDMEIVQEIADGLGLKFVPEKNEIPDQVRDDKQAFAPTDLLDYIYAVLHSPSYREKYKEFLKIDFPRVPYPSDAETFWQLVALGGELRQIHLLEHPVVDDFITTYPEAGSNEISYRLTKTQPGFIPYEEEPTPNPSREGNTAGRQSEPGERSTNEIEDKAAPPATTPADHRYPNEPLGKIQINKKQYFGRVPEKAWNFYIGGYQPAEKWLKDRRDRELSVDEIKHYQKIIVALMETDRIMQQIDAIEIEEAEPAN